jgi:hypothetical protein
MFEAVPSLLQEQLRPGTDSRLLIAGDSTAQIALSVAASPGKRKRSRADRMALHWGRCGGHSLAVVELPKELGHFLLLPLSWQTTLARICIRLDRDR